MWMQAIKDVSYAHLDLTIRQFRLHTQKQWDAMHNDLAKQFWYNPPLKPKALEMYMKEHLSYF